MNIKRFKLYFDTATRGFCTLHTTACNNYTKYERMYVMNCIVTGVRNTVRRSEVKSGRLIDTGLNAHSALMDHPKNKAIKVLYGT